MWISAIPTLCGTLRASGPKATSQAAGQLLPTLKRALTEDTVSVIACPVDYSENAKLTEKLEHLTQPSEIECRDNE
jgi:hypothetical protein